MYSHLNLNHPLPNRTFYFRDRLASTPSVELPSALPDYKQVASGEPAHKKWRGIIGSFIAEILGQDISEQPWHIASFNTILSPRDIPSSVDQKRTEPTTIFADTVEPKGSAPALNSRFTPSGCLTMPTIPVVHADVHSAPVGNRARSCQGGLASLGDPQNNRTFKPSPLGQ
ncbi:hypothetical protein FRB96_002915 [Tulasnella sp. 330]|nr:hypothetical protein FRB96_002915 [Tulasnella sp. 330]